MPRIGRVIVVGLAHHITQRGNYRQKVFEKREDYIKYINWINEYSKKYGIQIQAYCLMNNHVHFIAIPNNKDSISKTFDYTHMRYSQYKNIEKKASGHLWQGRFYSCVLDERHEIEAMRYIERNPVRAKLVKKAWEWEWTSAGEHIGSSESHIQIIKDKESLIMNKKEWKEFLCEKDQDEFIKEIRQKTSTGRPLGDESFIEKLEKEFEKRLVALPWGRPKKVEK